jgi:hypothetical protein
VLADQHERLLENTPASITGRGGRHQLHLPM